jgi:hypothetical protein
MLAIGNSPPEIADSKTLTKIQNGVRELGVGILV